MKRLIFIIVAARVGALCLGGPAALAAGTGGGAGVETQPEVRYLGEEAAKLARMSGDANSSPEAVAFRAQQDFERVPEVGTINLPPPSFHQWQMPSYYKKDCKCDGTLDSIIWTGKRALLDRGEVPSPLAQGTIQKLLGAAEMGDDLKARGKVEFDLARFLSPNMLGAYVYTKDHPVGVELNPLLSRIARKAGDLLAWFTFLHEYLHAYSDLVLKQLSPEQARLGEVYAFQGQAEMWEHVDPSGEMISVLYNDFVENGDDPELAQVVRHNVALRSAYHGGTLPEFVDGLGYHDEPGR